MKDFAIIGHFANGQLCFNGQTIKTQNVYEALCNKVGKERIIKIDSAGGLLFLFRLPIILYHTLKQAQQLIIMPAQNGVRIIPVLLVWLNHFFHRKLYYIVIGGWLPQMAKRLPALQYALRKLDGIFVETSTMHTELKQLGIRSVYVMPNFKHIPIRTTQEISNLNFSHPYPLCTFSRITPTKGIKEAIDAVKMVNARLQKKAYSLDIFGVIEDEKWFSHLMDNQPDYIQYKGTISPDLSVETLCNYYLLLFPTYYKGEGLAGTILDAMAAGVPVITTEWHNNTEIIQDAINGYLVPIQDSQSIANILYHLAITNTMLLDLRKNCLQVALRYTPDQIITDFLSTINYRTE